MPFIQTCEMDAPAIGVGSGLIEAFDPAMFAEQMFGFSGAETVGDEVILPLQKHEIIMRHDEVQKAGSGTDRAIALHQIHRLRHVAIEPNGPAMTATCNLHGAIILP